MGCAVAYSGCFDLSVLRFSEEKDSSLSGEIILSVDSHDRAAAHTPYELTLCGTLSHYSWMYWMDDFEAWLERPKLITVDESGNMDRGSLDGRITKEGATKTLTMTAVITDQPDTIANIAKRTKMNTRYPWMKRPRDKGELKYRSSSDYVRKKVLREIGSTCPFIYSVVASKTDFPPAKVSNITIYERLAKALMENVMGFIGEHKITGSIRIIFDSYERFNSEDAIKITKVIAERHGVTIDPKDISVQKSKVRKDLQAIDFVAGAIGTRYNRDRIEDFSIIAHRTMIHEHIIIDEEKWAARSQAK